jgi:hypothetical protein
LLAPVITATLPFRLVISFVLQSSRLSLKQFYDCGIILGSKASSGGDEYLTRQDCGNQPRSP